MRCPQCSVENRETARFCSECGARIQRVCTCGATLEPTSKFCDSCGTSVSSLKVPGFGSPDTYTPTHLADRILTSKIALEGERKHVTVLFAYLKGSMALIAD